MNDWITILQKLISLYQQLLVILTNQDSMNAQTTSMKLYTAAKNSLGKHMTLDDTIPAEVGCAEAVSAILSLVGISDGPKGIPGTANLYEWLVTNPRFVKIDTPEQGAILVSPTGFGNGSVEGHTGIFGAYDVQFIGDFGIMSNDSASGKFLETWSWSRWQAYYGKTGGLPLYIFKCV